MDSLVGVPSGEENLCGCLKKKKEKSELSFKGVRQCGIVPRYSNFIQSGTFYKSSSYKIPLSCLWFVLSSANQLKVVKREIMNRKSVPRMEGRD